MASTVTVFSICTGLAQPLPYQDCRCVQIWEKCRSTSCPCHPSTPSHMTLTSLEQVTILLDGSIESSPLVRTMQVNHSYLIPIYIIRICCQSKESVRNSLEARGFTFGGTKKSPPVLLTLLQSEPYRTNISSNMMPPIFLQSIPDHHESRTFLNQPCKDSYPPRNAYKGNYPTHTQ